MFNNSVKQWIPKKLNEQELVQQFADSIDWLLSVDFPDSDKLAKRFNSVKNKYRNLSDVPLEDIYAIIDETGYSYITNTLTLDETTLRTLLGYLNFIHMNKGTRRGLEFVFKILNMDYQITEWFEATPMATPMTYTIDLLSLSPDNISGFEIINKLMTFMKNYVYPVMEKMTIEFKMDTCSTNFASTYIGTVDSLTLPESDWLIWGWNDWYEHRWFSKGGLPASSVLTWDDIPDFDSCPDIDSVGATASGFIYFDDIIDFDAVLDLDMVGAVTVSLIPVMMSDSLPSGLAFSSEIRNTNFKSFKAFDSSSIKHFDNTNNYWTFSDNAINPYVGYMFNTVTSIDSYSLEFAGSNTGGNITASFTLQGSTDTTNGSNGTWTDLDVQTGVTHKDIMGDGNLFDSTRFNLPATVSYKAYRIIVNSYTGDLGNPTFVSVSGFKVY